MIEFKGQSSEIFDLQFFSFFHNLNLPGPLTNVKIFSSLVKSSRSYLIFRFEKTDSPGYIKFFFYPRTFYKNEKCSSLIVEYESIIVFVTLSL